MIILKWLISQTGNKKDSWHLTEFSMKSFKNNLKGNSVIMIILFQKYQLSGGLNRQMILMKKDIVINNHLILERNASLFYLRQEQN